MITIFTIPKPFKGLSATHQRNAIKSWLEIDSVEIILVGDDEGVEKTATEFNLKHIGDIKKSELGTPLLSSAFDKVKKSASNEILMYLNADIIIARGVEETLQSVSKLENYVVVGRRIDTDISDDIDFKSDGWKEQIKQITAHGGLHGYSGIDYLIFPRNIPINMPDFVVGRPGWDNWFLWKAKTTGIPIIDATNMIVAIHQNHGYSHSKYGRKNMVAGPEYKANIHLAGGRQNMLTIRESDFILTPYKKLIKPPLARRIAGLLAKNKLWLFLLSLKRNFQESLNSIGYFLKEKNKSYKAL